MKDIIEGYREVMYYALGDIDMFLFGKIIAFATLLFISAMFMFGIAGIIVILIKAMV